MSFGGSVAAMISTLKANARDKRKTIYNRDTSHLQKNSSHKIPQTEKKASPQLLEEIRNNMKEEKRKGLIKTILVLIIICFISVIIISYFNQNNFESIKEFLE